MKPLTKSKTATMILAMMIIAVGCQFGNAEEEEKPQEQESPIPRFEAGDLVAFRIVKFNRATPGNESCHIQVYRRSEFGEKNEGNKKPEIPEPTTKQEENLTILKTVTIPTSNFLSSGYLKNDETSEFTVLLWANFSYGIYLYQTTSMGGTGNILDSVGLYPFEVMLEFEKKATEKPNDPKEWMFDYKDARGNGSSVTLEFRGIVRRYELKGIDIPKDSELRKGKANAPILRVYIDRNGKPMPGSGLTAKVSAWTHDFPSGKSNVWYIREGIGENYLIRLRDANTTFREAFLLDRAEIKAEDFRANDGVIREKMDSLETESPAVKFRFAPIK